MDPLDIHSQTGVLYRLNAQGIHEYHFYDMRASTIDEWYESMHRIEQEAAALNQHVSFMFCLYRVWISPYGVRHWLKTSQNVSASHKSSSAIVLISYNSLNHKLIQLTMRQMSQTQNQARQIFLQEQAAVDWLNQRTELFNQ